MQIQPSTTGVGVTATGPSPSAGQVPVAPMRRTILDAAHTDPTVPGSSIMRPVRHEGQVATGDGVVDTLYDHLGSTRDFFETTLGRRSFDGNGGGVKAVVRWSRNFNQAAWDGEKLLFGDGDGRTFAPLARALDVVSHEFSHGVIQHTAGLEYEGQSGALSESFADVFAELAEQWSRDRGAFGSPDAARAAEWLVGSEVFTPDKAGDGLRSLRSPGTAHSGDLQPAHMNAYVRTPDDNGGVHINSGIPNRAAFEAAALIGSEKVGAIWYHALQAYLRPRATFDDAAAATLASAHVLYGSGPELQAVFDAWRAVGIKAVPGARPKSVAEQAEISARAPGAGASRAQAGGGVVPPWLLAGG